MNSPFEIPQYLIRKTHFFLPQISTFINAVFMIQALNKQNAQRARLATSPS